MIITNFKIIVGLLVICTFQTLTAKASEIHSAAMGGRADFIRELADDDPFVLHQKDAQGNTPLHLAAAYDHEVVVNEILRYRVADVDEKNNDAETPLYKAARFGSVNIVELLLKERADPFIKNTDKSTIMHAVAMSINQESASIAKRLIGYKVLINAKDSWGMTPLHATARSGNTDVAEVLLKNGADITSEDNLGRNALHWAAESGKAETAQLLLEYNIPLNVVAINSGAPIHLAVEANQSEIVKLLLNRKKYLAITDSNGKTPLRLALELNYREIINILVQLGATH